MPYTVCSLQQGRCPLSGAILPLESETDTSKALEGHTHGLPSCIVAHPELTVTGRNLRKTKRSHKLHYSRFPPKRFLAFYIQHYGFLIGDDSLIFPTQLQKDPFN